LLRDDYIAFGANVKSYFNGSGVVVETYAMEAYRQDDGGEQSGSNRRLDTVLPILPAVSNK